MRAVLPRDRVAVIASRAVLDGDSGLRRLGHAAPPLRGEADVQEGGTIGDVSCFDSPNTTMSSLVWGSNICQT